MMYAVLQRYLDLHRQLIIPGIGTFSIHRSPAEFDHASRLVLPATYSILLHHDNAKPTSSFYKWLARAVQVSNEEIELHFNSFANDLRKEILAGKKVVWENIGLLSKGMAGEIRFESSLRSYNIAKPITAKKMIRENADHMIRVGEEQRTSTEMLELLQTADPRRSKRSLMAAVLALIAIVFLIIYLAKNGWHSGNQQAVDLSVPDGTYQVVQ